MEDKLTVVAARSDYNGIAFHSNDYDFYYLIKQAKKGKIIKKKVISLDPTFAQQIYCNTKKHPTLFAFISLILLLFLSIITKEAGIFTGGSYFLFWSHKKFYDFIIMVWILNTNKKGRVSAQYHAAEHMTINAYLKYQRVPTMSEIEQSSPLSKNCGSLLTINHIVFYFVNAIFFGLINSCTHFIILLVLIITANILMNIGKERGWFRFFEYLVVRKPTKKQLRLAREGISYYHETESLIKELKANPKYTKYFED